MTTDAVSPSLPPLARIVIRSPNWLGDAVMALPAMGSIRSAYPEAVVAVAAVAAVAPMFREGAGIDPDEIITVDHETEARRLEAGRFDAAVLFPNSFRSAWSARRGGIRERWGYGAGFRGWMLTRAVARPGGRLHQAARYGHLVRALGFSQPDGAPRIEAVPPTMARAAALLKEHGIDAAGPIVGLAPGAAYGHAKRWPPRRAAELVARLTREAGATCVLVGAAADRDAGREIESAMPSGATVVDLIGRTDLRVLVGVLQRCVAFVSNDSGAMHLAAAAGVPVTAIFGPTDERVTSPIGPHDVLVHQVFCRPCMLRDCPIDHRCMNGISVDAVYASVVRHLSSPDGRTVAE